MQYVEYRYLNPLDIAVKDFPAINQTAFETVPQLVGSLLKMYSYIGLNLNDLHLKNYPHEHMGQIAQINIQALAPNDEGGILDFLSASANGEIKYTTNSITPPHKCYTPTLVGQINTSGIIEPYIEKLDYEKYQASHDFIEAINSDYDFNRQLALALMTFCTPSMRNSSVNVRQISKEPTPNPQFSAQIFDERFGSVNQLIVPIHM